jgi:hypothetical protein
MHESTFGMVNIDYAALSKNYLLIQDELDILDHAPTSLLQGKNGYPGRSDPSLQCTSFDSVVFHYEVKQMESILTLLVE